jgi:hypothetical protein
MNQLFNVPDLHSAYRYSTHAFVDKVDVRPVQTADILAWHHAADAKKIMAGRPSKRADFVALIENQPVMLRLAAREHLERMRKQVDAALAGRTLISGTFGASSFVSEV